MFTWDDTKYFLAVARHGSTLAAARALKLSQSTVHRRLKELETSLGCTLVIRSTAGFRLTETGQELLPLAEDVERTALALGRRGLAMGRAEADIIRLSCPEPVMLRIVRSSMLERFHERHPRFRVEFVMSDVYVDLAKGEADVALRSGDVEDSNLVGRKIADSLWSVYASRGYVQRRGLPEQLADLNRHDVVGFEGGMAGNRAAAWLAGIAPDATIAARVSSVLGLVSVAKSGLAIVPMPIALGNDEPDLVRLFDQVPELARTWRILAHPDARSAPGVSALFDFIAGEIETLRPILTG